VSRPAAKKRATKKKRAVAPLYPASPAAAARYWLGKVGRAAEEEEEGPGEDAGEGPGEDAGEGPV
jgi:hypothetical protein